MGYSPWGHKELDTTERLHTLHSAYKLNNRVTICSLDTLLFLFDTSLLFHVWF